MYPLSISGVLSLLSIVFFVASSDKEDMVENLSTMEIKSNSGQDMNTFYSDNWKTTLYHLFFLEQRK